MAQIVSIFVTEDEDFKKQIGRLLRSGAISRQRAGSTP